MMDPWDWDIFTEVVATILKEMVKLLLEDDKTPTYKNNGWIYRKKPTHQEMVGTQDFQGIPDRPLNLS